MKIGLVRASVCSLVFVSAAVAGTVPIGISDDATEWRKAQSVYGVNHPVAVTPIIRPFTQATTGQPDESVFESVRAQ